MDAINPNHYKGFSNGAEVIDITENLTFNAGNVVEGRIEDMKKSRWYADREIKRLGGDSSSDNLEFVVKNVHDDVLRGIGITSDNVEVADKIIERRNHPAYSGYELVLTLRKA